MIAVLIDESQGRAVAKSLGLTALGTIGVLLKALEENLIHHDEYEDCLAALSDAGFYPSPDVFQGAIQLGNELSDKA